jgi:glycosyltransferase involved in cell wall biosynthesis
LLAKPNDFEALSRLIQNLIDNPEKISEFGQTSMKRQKEMFSLESYINNFSNQYEKLSE